MMRTFLLLLAIATMLRAGPLQDQERAFKSGGQSGSQTATALDRLAKIPQKPNEPPGLEDQAALDGLLSSRDADVLRGAVRLAAAWKVATASNRLGELAGSAASPARQEAFEALRQIGGTTALAQFSMLTRPDQPPETRAAALVAIAEISLDGAVMAAPEVLRALPDEASALQTWRKLLAIPRAAQSFATRLPSDLPPHAIKAGAQAAAELGEAGKPLGKALTRAAARTK